MNADPTTVGYEPEPTDVAAEVAAILEEITDPIELYERATAAQVHHQAVVEALSLFRSRCLAGLNTPGVDGTKSSFEQISGYTGLTRGGVQKLVQRGRSLLDCPFPTPLTPDDVHRFLKHGLAVRDARAGKDVS
ncbi:hypothetical protein [Streptomyces botrytidirepellens]|uniref:Uncharacterized protein n=1 Tax=Streptomyces botrytidirepellens TaxID=2486417 RepID=A0A3M8T7Y2_9ACTN|nr:hypothetical protein [Streptomyces botrytidirepellens]RNF86762.1 hypothetical protein EEJ42_42915 [Streptomyces botrytidirepellens]